MPRKRVFLSLALTLLIMASSFWLWGTNQWSGEQIESQSITDTVELAIAEFRHQKSDVIRITAVRSHPINSEISIDFEGFDKATSPKNFITRGSRKYTVAMINGGYFDASFQPVGLLIKDGQTVSKISQQPALSGVLAIYTDQSVQLIPRGAYLPDDSIDSAIQAGPFIVDPGGKAGIKSDDLKKAKRTAIGQTLTGEIVFITTTPCTLFELSEILTQHPDKLGVKGFDRVLNLDGGPSTGLFLKGMPSYHVAPETNVPNTILMRTRWR